MKMTHLATIAACTALLSAAPEPSTTPGKSSDPLNRTSPQSTVAGFLEACHAHDYQKAWRYLDLRKLSTEDRLKDGASLAQQLEQILNHDVEFDAGALSKKPEGDHPGRPDRERVDSFPVDGKTLDIELERVTLRSGSKVWLFSSESVALIPRLARIARDTSFEKKLPESMVASTFMGTSLWRWIALLLLAACLAAISKLLSRVAVSWLQPVLKRWAPKADGTLLEVFSGPIRLLLVVAGFRAGMEWIAPSPAVQFPLQRLVTFLSFAGVAWLCIRSADLGVLALGAALEAKHQTFTHSVLPLASRVLKIAIICVTAAAVLSSWGYNTTTIVAGLGVGGVAIALAAQKTIENLFGGVAVITDRPVAVGDFCRFGDLVGTVEYIGLRSTRVRTLNRTVLTVPNGQFSSMTLENFSKRDKMWFHLTLNLRRDTTPDQVRTLLDSIAHGLTADRRIETGNLPVRFVGVGTYSLDLEIFAYVLTRDYDEFLRIQQDLFLWILDEVETAGTTLAVPTQAYYAFGGNPKDGAAAALEPVAK